MHKRLQQPHLGNGVETEIYTRLKTLEIIIQIRFTIPELRCLAEAGVEMLTASSEDTYPGFRRSESGAMCAYLHASTQHLHHDLQLSASILRS